METTHNYDCQVVALNDLIRINNDRITGYKKRMDVTLDDDLDDLFVRFIYQSKLNNDDLIRCIKYLGGKPANKESLSGRFYHAWTDSRSTPHRETRQTTLDYCEYCEDVAKSAYQKVLTDHDFMQGNSSVIKLLETHLDELKTSHTLTKTLRDDASAAA